MSNISKNSIIIEDAQSKKEGYNWTNTLKVHSVISGLLALISATLFGYMSIFLYAIIIQSVQLFLAISFILFIVSVDLYVTSISFNVFNLSESLKESLKIKCEEEKLDWQDFIKNQLLICKKKKDQAKIVCNFGLLSLFIAFFIMTIFGSGFFILSAGIGYLSWQFLYKRQKENAPLLKYFLLLLISSIGCVIILTIFDFGGWVRSYESGPYSYIWLFDDTYLHWSIVILIIIVFFVFSIVLSLVSLSNLPSLNLLKYYKLGRLFTALSVILIVCILIFLIIMGIGADTWWIGVSFYVGIFCSVFNLVLYSIITRKIKQK